MPLNFLKVTSRVLCVGVVGLAISHAFADAPTAPTTAPITVATTGPATTTASAIVWDQAGKHIGETLTITGPVLGTHVTTGGKALILNIGKDFPDPDRFSVMINTDGDNKASEDTYIGKNITVTGKIELYRKVPEVKVNPTDVTVEK